MRIDLHLISWNRPAMTELTIRTIHRNTKRESFRLVVIDNGSDLATTTMLDKLKSEGLIDELDLFSENKGLEAARDWALFNATESDYFICVDNDCLPPPKEHSRDKYGFTYTTDWVERLCFLMEKYDDFGAISARNPVMIGTGNIFLEAEEAGDDIVEFSHPGGSLRIMLTELIRSIGGWDRHAVGRGSEETYISAKIHDAGFRTAFAVNIPCLHLFGLREGAQATDRWGYDASMVPEASGHHDIDHPALRNGDDMSEVEKFAGKELADAYGNN